ncbi:MAG: hypothetical protein JJU32_08995 [Phormidium sp. BM_Day4_Bin.17]|nr:hypothetical protein [Phormidium sp. BM_Day4_Bin.17]UCJ11595.1 MAG: hypothetical protein JWS08_17870 [Phormidium sp. PBR-2020]
MSDPQLSLFQLQLQRLHRLTVLARWSLVVFLWISVGSLSLWALRREISLWLEHFTWVAIWYALRSHPWPALGLGLCVGWTVSVLVWQSRNIIWGLPNPERRRLEHQLWRIRTNGAKHPLWKWVVVSTTDPDPSKKSTSGR